MNNMQDPEISVVVPVFNSQSALEELTVRLHTVFGQMGKSFELILVDDRSRDQSWEVIGKLCRQYPETVTGVALNRNFGQHQATLCGLAMVRGSLVITLDDDLQHPPEEIKKLVAAWEEAPSDVIYGVFGNRKKHSSLRNAGSRTLKTMSRLWQKSPGEGSSFRLMSRSLADNIARHRLNFIFIDEIILWYTDDIRFVDVEHHRRRYDTSNYSGLKLLRIVSNLVIYYTNAPLRIMVWGGFLASFISLVLGLVYIVKKIFWNVPLGYTSLIVAILFSTSIILFSLGIIGEYLSRIYMVQNKKPPYSIGKIINHKAK